LVDIFVFGAMHIEAIGQGTAVPWAFILYLFSAIILKMGL
jgi:hypothetical protein